jgi:diketogulonate reductase-like aldo/keto reductase
MSTPHVTLYPTGQKMPQVGMGTWKLANNLCEETIYQAIKVGFRHFDAACDYGNEFEVGLGVKKAIDEGIVKREDLFITSKVLLSFLLSTRIISLKHVNSCGILSMQRSTSCLSARSSSRILVLTTLIST